MWKEGLKASRTIAIPRWYGFHRDECQNVQLHVFCDVSEIAYGTVAYFRTVTRGCINVSFVISKTRLAPIKALTVPRLELQAAVMASRLKSKIFEEIDLEIDETHFWSDSKIVLHYLSNTQRRFSTYVSHRIAEIASNSDVKDWHHIPGKMNVADDCTRVQDIHERQFHVGREHTLALLRQQFWILRRKSFVRRIINKCLLCKRRRAKPTVPVMASLPRERLALCQPPYFGPISVKRGRVAVKRWGCIFTCLTTRAVHLEVAGDLSTDSFTLRRFRGRRGDPKTIRSDNGTNFVGANRELGEALKSLSQERISGELAQENIAWYFNPPSSPHMGGIFESMVKQVKRPMKTVINDQVLPEETLHTVLVETEAIVNSRPLTPVSDDPNDYEALTPTHSHRMSVTQYSTWPG